MRQRNCIIVHGSNPSEKEAKGGKPENLRHWKPWLKRNLEKSGIKTSNELYPKDWLPNYEKWKKIFEENIINENKRKVDKVILVCPSTIKTGKYKKRSKLKDFNYDSSLKKYFNKIVLFYSDNDPFVNIIESAKQVHEKLGGKLICIN